MSAISILSQGKSFPVGTSKTQKGINFCVFSHHAEKIELQFFDHKNDGEPTHTFGILSSLV